MRTYGRIYFSPNVYVWQEISSDAVAGDGKVWLTTLVQCLKLILGESPFFADHGIPAQQSVIQQIFPNYYVARTQSQFLIFFASLIISQIQNPEPRYKVDVTLNNGVRLPFIIDGQFFTGAVWDYFLWDETSWL